MRVAVTVACVAVADIPPLPNTTLKKGLDLKQGVAGTGADLKAWQQYGAKADALLRGCAE